VLLLSRCVGLCSRLLHPVAVCVHFLFHPTRLFPLRVIRLYVCPSVFYPDYHSLPFDPFVSFTHYPAVCVSVGLLSRLSFTPFRSVCSLYALSGCLCVCRSSVLIIIHSLSIRLFPLRIIRPFVCPSVFCPDYHSLPFDGRLISILFGLLHRCVLQWNNLCLLLNYLHNYRGRNALCEKLHSCASPSV
jgi:hypothetical protein